MTVAANRERSHYVETAACDRRPLERVGEDRAEWNEHDEMVSCGPCESI